MNLHTRIVRSPELISAPVQEELVMFNAETGKYYNLNAVAATVWQRLENPVTVKALCAELTDNYEISPERCQAEILAFLVKLEAKGLIRRIGQNA